MILNEFGKIVEQQWLWLAEHFSYVQLHEFVIMPDHFHGIIEIKRPVPAPVPVPVGAGRDLRLRVRVRVQTHDIKIKPLYDLIGAFKMTASKKIHETGFESFIWQRSFHDRIIRNDLEYFAIAEYIMDNPAAAQRKIPYPYP